MNQLFNILILIVFLGMLLYSIFYNRKHIFPLLGITLSSLFVMHFLNWKFSALAFLLILIPLLFYKKLSYSMLATTSMVGSIVCSYFLLSLYLNTGPNALLFFLGTFSIVLICFLAIIGIMKNNLVKFLLLSNLIQLSFVFLDLSVAKMQGKIAALGVIQIFNYTLAGILLFVALGILIEENKHKYLSELKGYYYKDPHIAIFASIAAISLAGLPGLNIFVSEWLLFTASFKINPIITIWGIFAALLLFIMYFKIIYILLSGKRVKREVTHPVLQAYNWIIAVACIVFGLIPSTQLYLLGLFI